MLSAHCRLRERETRSSAIHLSSEKERKLIINPFSFSLATTATAAACADVAPWTACVAEVVCVKLTGLHVPDLIYLGEGFWLNCTYDLETEPLYSIKWFKKNNEVKEEGPWSEIYHYIPNEEREDVKKVYSMRGVHIDPEKSSLGNVYVTTADQETEGTYKCEVSADAPTFETVRQERDTRLFCESRCPCLAPCVCVSWCARLRVSLSLPSALSLLSCLSSVILAVH